MLSISQLSLNTVINVPFRTSSGIFLTDEARGHQTAKETEQCVAQKEKGTDIWPRSLDCSRLASFAIPIIWVSEQNPGG